MLFDGKGFEYIANITEILDDKLKVSIEQSKTVDREAHVDITIAFSVPKGKLVNFLIQKCAELGVKTLTPIYCDRSVVDIRSKSDEKIEKWKMRLSSVFNRGFWDGYYLGQKLGEWNDVYGSKALLRKVYIAKNLNYFRQIGVAEFLCESDSLQVGDMILIMGPSTGVIEHVVDEIRVDLDRVEKAHPGQRFSISVPEKVRRADKLYKLIKNP